MSDVDKHAPKKGIFSCSWLRCSGGCNRKYLRKKEKASTKAKRKSSWCFDELWSCIRCLMRRKNSCQENEATRKSGEDHFYCGIGDVKNSPEKSCSDAVSSHSEKTEVNVIQADLSKDQEVKTKILIDKDLQGRTDTTVSDEGCQTAPERAEGGFINHVGDQEPSFENDASLPTLKSCSDVSSPDPEKFLDMIARFQSSRLNEQRADLRKLPVVKPKRVTFQSSTGSLVSPSLVKLMDAYKNIQLDHLEYVRTLGKGGFGHVELVALKTDRSHTFALKSMKKQYIVKIEWQKQVFREKNIMMKLSDCPFVIRLYKTFKDTKYIYMLMEPCLGGDLKTLLKKRKYFNYDEARFYIGCVLLALQYMHSKGIAHRDIKPANMLLDCRGYLKLGDFGLSKEIGVGKKIRSTSGTTSYIAPEVVLATQFGTEVDFWSVGIVIYELLSGKRPFFGSSTDVHNQIEQGINAIRFSRKIGSDAEDLVRGLCKSNAKERLGWHGVREIKEHKWFEQFDWDSLASQSMNPPFDPQVTGATDCRNFKKRRKRSRVPPDETSGWDKHF